MANHRELASTVYATALGRSSAARIWRTVVFAGAMLGGCGGKSPAPTAPAQQTTTVPVPEPAPASTPQAAPDPAAASADPCAGGEPAPGAQKLMAGDPKTEKDAAAQ